MTDTTKPPTADQGSGQTPGSLERVKQELRKAVGATEGHCYICKQPFTDANVFTTAGWKETAISGMCEKCWDEMFAEDDVDMLDGLMEDES